MEKKQIYNYNMLINTTGGAQTADVVINVPFKVGKIVFHPARTTAADNATHFWLMRESITNGYCAFIDGSSGRGSTQLPIIKHTYAYPLTVNGNYTFSLLSSDILTGQAAVNYNGIIWLHIEFHEA